MCDKSSFYNLRIIDICADLKADTALATVSVGRMRGMPDPTVRVEGSAPELFVTTKYYIFYEFPSHHAPNNLVIHSSYTFPSHKYQKISV